MRQWIKLFENTDEFSTKGHADIKNRPTDPRFSDNPLVSEPEMIDEFVVTDSFDPSTTEGTSELDRLHDAFARGGISDQEIKQGVTLTPEGMQKVAAAFGTSPDRIKLLINSLVQQLRDHSDDDIEESYHRFMEDGSPFAHADDDANDHLSAEPDVLGDVTVRSAKTGNSRFLQGSQAQTVQNRLDAAGNDDKARQNVLRPLIEDDEDIASDAISMDGGTYNFPWAIEAQSGLGTMAYGLRDGRPYLKLISIRDAKGHDLEVDEDMTKAIFAQAKAFIPDA